MSLTFRRAPLGSQPAGQFQPKLEVPDHVIYLEPSPRRVRVLMAGEPVADSRRMALLHETDRLPVYHFPVEDVRRDLLRETDHRRPAAGKGVLRFWDVGVGDRVAERAAWTYHDVPRQAPPLDGYAAFRWDSLDAWYEEDEQVFGHPRDPYHRIDVRTSSSHVRVVVDGETVAESRRAKLLFETGLPTRYYLPRDDVRTELLFPSDTTTVCAYKGEAVYWSVEVGDARHDDLVWSYPDPLDDAVGVGDYLCFFNERAVVEVDGEAEERPQSPWS